MKITCQIGKTEKVKTDALILFAFQERKLPRSLIPVDRAARGQISKLLKSGDFSGKEGEVAVSYPEGKIPARRILVAGLGKKSEVNLETCRHSAGKALCRARDLGARECHLLLPEMPAGVGSGPLAQALTEGGLIALYQYEEYKTEKTKKQILKVTFLARSEAERRLINSTVTKSQIIVDSVNFARDLVNGPANKVTPEFLAGEARRLAREERLKLKIFGPAEIKKMGMGGLGAVSVGSTRNLPRFLVLEYPGKGRAGRKPVALVGKGITFDSGGISIKPANGMEEMKTDMAGAAAVLGTLRAAARLKLSPRIVGFIPATENMPSGSAYRPGDVLRPYSGPTVEVISTDAEGRLILADALAYAREKYRPEAIIDLATLTGACIIALGREASGLLGNNPKLIEKIIQAGEESGERVWQLPLWKEYDEAIKSEVADIKNTGNREAGTIIGGIFLKRFVGETPWAHLDIAGTAREEKGRRYLGKGATGVGIRLLIKLLQDW